MLINSATVFTQIYVCTVAFANFLFPQFCLCGKCAMGQWCWHINGGCLKKPFITLKSDWLWVLNVYNTRRFNISLYCLSLSYTPRWNVFISFNLLANAKHAGIRMLNKVRPNYKRFFQNNLLTTKTKKKKSTDEM